MKRTRLVMIGNGMAGCRALEELLKLAPDLYDITVFGSEPHPNYTRILLSPVLAGEMRVQDIILNDLDWYRSHGITLHAGKRVERIDRTVRRVIAQDGTQAEYDRLLLATGSNPFILPVPGHDLPGVVTYRDIADTEAMIAAAHSHRRAVVIGAGLLGLEAANGLALRGMQVTVVHLMPWIMERQLDRLAAGMLQRSLEAKGNDIGAGGGALQALHSIDASAMDPRLAEVQFEIACDVDNPLTGEYGASAIFGPQKGADAKMVQQLDACLGRFAEVVLACHNKDIDATPGAGAAGGLGGAFLAFTRARLKSGIDIVLDAVEIDRHLEGTDLVITGEGRIDSQTVRGKTPVGVSKRAQRAGVPVIALAGSVSEDSDLVHEHGIDALFSIVPGVVSLPQALEDAADNLYRTARNIAATWQLAQAFEAKRR
jgi:hypothetical protein